nr:PREDICTED: uncharacterized protein LOC102122063 isoform X1 [Macaca fascicularis]
MAARTGRAGSAWPRQGAPTGGKKGGQGLLASRGRLLWLGRRWGRFLGEGRSEDAVVRRRGGKPGTLRAARGLGLLGCYPLPAPGSGAGLWFRGGTVYHPRTSSALPRFNIFDKMVEILGRIAIPQCEGWNRRTVEKKIRKWLLDLWCFLLPS